MMIAEAAKRLGAQTVALDVSEDAPAFRVCDEHVVARSFDDAEALERLCAAADVVTYEFENIPAQVLMPLAERYNIKQGVRQLLDSQDRLVEKRNAERGGLPCGGYMAVDSADDLRRGVERFGYPVRAEKPSTRLRRTRTEGAALGRRFGGCREDARRADDSRRVHRFRLRGERNHGRRQGAYRNFPRRTQHPQRRHTRFERRSRSADDHHGSRTDDTSERGFHAPMRLRGNPRDRVFRARRGCDIQRNGSATAQQRTLYHRGLHDRPVYRVGALPARRTASRAATRSHRR